MSVINSVVGTSIPSVSVRDALSSPVSSHRAGASDAPVRTGQQSTPSAESASPTGAFPAAGSPRSQSVGPAPTKAQVNQALEDMIKRLQPDPTSVQFSIDDKLNQVVIKVIDPKTNEVIKQIPAEAIMKMREDLLAMDGKTPPAGTLLSEKT